MNPPRQFNQPTPPPKRLGCLAWAGIVLGLCVCSRIVQTIKRVAAGGDWAGPAPEPAAASGSASAARPSTPAADDNPNVADQVKVVGYDVKWHPGAGNPNGPDLAWVTVFLKNGSKHPVGVVWANVVLRNAAGQELENAKKEIVYYAEPGERGPLPAGAT